LDEILKESGKPESAIETDSMFETVLAARVLNQEAQSRVPERFEAFPAYPLSDDYGFWHRFLDVTGMTPAL
jgi:hypothetical protein